MYLIERWIRRWIRTSISCVLVLFIIGSSVLDGKETEHRVGLVLSGGGARGAAHIGILKVLERENIPIDCIAGTSFGALVGGLYALGYRAEEIEAIFIQQDWSRFFSDAPERQLAPFSERKNSDLQVHLSINKGMPELPSGVWEIQQLREILNERTTEPMLKAQSDFDRLYIPFRAVATDLINNQPHIFREGSMTEALRASIAIPGILTPVETKDMLLNDTLLVDGGLKNNLPVDIARDEMEADYIIAVDVSSPLLGKDEIGSLFDVTDQAQSLQIQDNIEKNRHFTPGVLMTPDLNGYTMLDFEEMPEIIRRGEKEAEKWLEKFKEEVGVRRPKPRPDREPEERIIDTVDYKGLKNVSRRQMEREIRTLPGNKMDLSVLISDMKRLYATKLFDSVDFKLERISGNHYELIFKVKESSMHTLDAGIRYDNDYEFVAMAEFTTRQLFTSPTSFTIASQFGGLEDHSAAFRYTPAIIPFLFIETEVHARRRERQYFKDHEWDGAYAEEFLGGSVRFGGTLWNKLEISAGYHLDYVDIIGGIEDRNQEGSQKLAGLTLRLSCDTLDNQEFPTRGMDLELTADSAEKHFGGDFNYLKVLLKYDKYLPISDQSTLGFNLQMGDMGVDAPFYDSFYIGGYSFSRKGSYPLLGFDRDEILSREMAVARIEYRRRIYNPSFSFVRNAYLTALFNAGAVQGMPGTDLLGAGVGLALDTMLGPMRMTGGFGAEGQAHFHFTFGPTF